MITAARTADVHRPLGPEQDLARILAICEERVVQHDWTIRWHNVCLQLANGNDVEPGQSVMIYEQLDGRVRAFAGSRELSWGKPNRPPAVTTRPAIGRMSGSSQGQRPAANRPWRGRSRTLPSTGPHSPTQTLTP